LGPAVFDRSLRWEVAYGPSGIPSNSMDFRGAHSAR